MLFLRERMTETAYACMDGQTAAVTVAMLLGDTSGVEEGLLQNIRYGGIAHIFAVSGLHIGAVFLFCTLLFKNNRLPRWIRFFLVAALVLLYGGVCGYSASVVRAIVTCLTLYACKLIGLKYDSLESLSLAALITFAAYPTLLFGVGAQLSFAACAGIALLKRGLERVLLSAWTGADKFVLQKIFKRPPPLSVDMFSQNQPPLSLYTLAKRSVCSFLGVTLSAQVLTAPVLYLSFGYFSPISVLLNMVFVPLVSAVFCILLALVLIACLLPTAAGAVLLYVPNVVWAALLIAFEAVDFSALITMGTALPIGGLIAYFCAAAFCTDKFNVTRKEKAGYALLFAAALIVCMIAANV